MVWKKTDVDKPAYEYDEKEETKKVDKKTLESHKKQFVQELVSDNVAPEQPIPHKPTVVVFDSKIGNLEKKKE